jgi:hypothetical protein
MKAILVSLVIALGPSGSTAAPVPTHLFPTPVPTTFGAVQVGETFTWCGRGYLKIETTVAFVYATSNSDSMYYVQLNARCYDDRSVLPLFDSTCPVN